MLDEEAESGREAPDFAFAAAPVAPRAVALFGAMAPSHKLYSGARGCNVLHKHKKLQECGGGGSIDLRLVCLDEGHVVGGVRGG